MKHLNSSSDGSPQNNLNEVFLEQLADVFDAEQQLILAIPAMARAAHAISLQAALEMHLSNSQLHAQRVEDITAALGRRLKARKCRAMKGLLQEAEEAIAHHKKEPALDALLIGASQKIKHYKIATYGTLCEWARQLDLASALHILDLNVQDERTANVQLTGIAQNLTHHEAAATLQHEASA